MNLEGQRDSVNKSINTLQSRVDALNVQLRAQVLGGDEDSAIVRV